MSCLLALGAHAQTPLSDAFNPGADKGAQVLAVQANGQIVVGGFFTMLAGKARFFIGRLNADGTLDPDFDPDANAAVNALALQTDGRILVGGDFGLIGGQTRPRIARLNADGTLDTGFHPEPGGPNKIDIYALAVQADGKILVGGGFSTMNGQARYRLARLNADGTLAPDFNPDVTGGFPSAYVYALAVQPDRKILVGGYFTTVSGQPRNRIARLNEDGTLDAGFNPGAGSAVFTLALQADGKILVGGEFTTLGGQTRRRIGRLNTDGTLDLNFNPGADNDVLSFAVQADGRILVGGSFLMIGGEERDYIARLNADGTLDGGFDPGANSGVYSMAIQPDGKILTAGFFTTLGGQSRWGIGRLHNTQPANHSLSYAASTITWQRGGTTPEVSRTTFERTTPEFTWTNLGAGTRVAGGWQITIPPLPANTAIRARGQVAGGGEGAGWLVESLLATAPQSPPAIVVGDPDFRICSSNGLGFTIRGQSGQVVVVEGTDGFGSVSPTKWRALYTNTVSGSALHFCDTNRAPSLQQFYRVRLWP